MTEILGYIAVSIMGLVLGLLGGGGAILTVPILVYIFGLDVVQATTSSLFIVSLAAFVASIKFGIRKEIDYKIVLFFALPSFLGIYLARSVVLPFLPDVIFSFATFDISKADIILISFALLMVSASYAMLKKKKETVSIKISPSKIRVVIQGVLVGFITGFVGAGGGFLIIPVLTNLIGLRMRMAIGTSLLIIGINSIFGFSISYLGGSEVHWMLQISIVAIAIVGSLIGSHFSNQFDENKLKRSFGYLILLLGSLIILNKVLN